MRKAIWLATAAVSVLAAAPALAQTTPTQSPNPESAAQAPVPTGPAQSAPEVDTAQRGVLVFEPAFFAGSSPIRHWT